MTECPETQTHPEGVDLMPNQIKVTAERALPVTFCGDDKWTVSSFTEIPLTDVQARFVISPFCLNIPLHSPGVDPDIIDWQPIWVEDNQTFYLAEF
ncbi:hypothetical protein JW766_01390 [Candidatus Dojkabacteria bacterium]|nr:hypothetical protein [Candidatus Dojkabacteria bacterium]